MTENSSSGSPMVKIDLSGSPCISTTPKRSRLSAAEKAKRAEEKEARGREREEKRVQREAEEAAKQQRKEDQKRQRELLLGQKEEQKRQREFLLAQREEVKRQREAEQAQRDDERKLREEEKVRKDTEKLREEEEKNKRLNKQKSLFTNFFVPCKSKGEFVKPLQKIRENLNNSVVTINVDDDAVDEVEMNVTREMACDAMVRRFDSFPLRADSRLGDICRLSSSAAYDKVDENLNQLFSATGQYSKDDASSLYLSQLKCPDYPRKQKAATWPFTFAVPQIKVIDGVKENAAGENVRWHHYKVLQFTENVRPPYYGTWSKRSKKVSGRRPFSRDDDQLDYSVDSEENWEIEAEGESITKSNDEDEEAVVVDNDEEDGEDFIVPHGYLSEDEGLSSNAGDDESASGAQEEGEAIRSAQIRKIRQKISQSEFEASMKKTIVPLKRHVAGLYCWGLDVSDESVREGVKADFAGESKALESYLTSKMYFWEAQLPLKVSYIKADASGDVVKKRKKSVPLEAMPYLIRLLHLNPRGRKFLNFEFRMFWEQHCNQGVLPTVTFEDDCRGIDWDSFSISKTRLNAEIAALAKRSGGHWCVNEEAFERYGVVLEPGAKNDWQYVALCVEATKENQSKVCQIPSASSALEKATTPITNFISSNKGCL